MPLKLIKTGGKKLITVKLFFIAKSKRILKSTLNNIIISIKSIFCSYK